MKKKKARDHKNPAWKADWERLVGSHKYLMIRNWDSFQVVTPSGVPAHWIKSYVNQDFDEPLSVFEGGLLTRLRNFRGRHGSNLPADVSSLHSGCNVPSADRPRACIAYVSLLQRGRLVPTNEQDVVSKKSIVENRRDKYTCNGCGKKSKDLTEYVVPYQNEPRRLCKNCVDTAEEPEVDHASM